ncbi:MAG: mechanosensitive ion channel [Enhygromyxa sp.]
MAPPTPTPTPTPTPMEPAELGVRLLSELDALRELSSLGLLVWDVLVIALAWVIAWAGPASVRTAWRLGLDPRRRLGLLSSAARILGLLIGSIGVLRPVLTRAPLLGIAALIVAVALAGLVAPMQLRNLASGLSLATRSRLREGDLVTIGALEGTVIDVGLLRVSLRTVDGGVTHVPAADFEREALTVGSRRAAVPIEARVIAGLGFDDRALERLRRALWLSPYRRAGTDPRIAFDIETGRVEVRMDTWAVNAAVEVEQHLRILLLEITRKAAGDPPVAEEAGS